MIVLHALYNPRNPLELILFGENCTPENSERVSQVNTECNIPHPFATDTTDIKTLIQPFFSEPLLPDTSLNLEFPSDGTSLIGSPERSIILGKKPVIPHQWTLCEVPIITSYIDLLLYLPRIATSDDPEYISGGSIRFWSVAADLAAEIVRRGRYLPGTGIYRNGGICTRWKLIPSSYDLTRIDLLVKAMPHNQRHFFENKSPDDQRWSRRSVVILFLESMIMRIITRSEQSDPSDPGIFFTPIERLKSAQELTALYYLQGYERHKMPVSHPQLTNGWKRKFDTWVTLPVGSVPDDLPWTFSAQVEEVGGKKEREDLNEVKQKWQIFFYVQSPDVSGHPIPVRLWEEETDLSNLELPEISELERLLQSGTEIIIKTAPYLNCSFVSRFQPIIKIEEEDLIRFLTYDAPNIINNGLNIIFPTWWGCQVQPIKIQLSVRHMEENQKSSTVGLHTLLNYDYRASIGDDIVDPAEFRKMVEQKTSMVRIGKRWVRIDHDHLNQIITKTEKRFKRHSLSIADFLRLYARGESQDEDLKVLAGDSWMTNLIAFIRNGWQQASVKIPASFCGTLRPYQETGLAFLITCRSIGFGSCLADDMGLGKTPQTIAYLLAAKEEGSLSGPSLLICPTSIIGNWERELTRFSPGLSFSVHHGSGRMKDERFFETAKAADLIITSYALVHRDLHILSQISWSTLILDEVQNIKNAQTKQFQAVRNLSAQHQIALTGTPVENHLSELWAIMEILNPGFLGSLTSFQKIYANPIEKGNAEEKAIELRRLIRPFLLRRVKTDTTVINDLPEKMEMKVYCPLTHEQAALYQATLNDLAAELRTVFGIARRGRVLAALTRLKQICNHPAQITKSTSCEPERSGKVKRLIEMLEEVREEGDAAIIFTQYATFAQVLAKQIQTDLMREVLLLTGSTPRMKREEMISRFMRSDGPQFFVISLRAGGTGLNLMRATHVFHIDRWWNPAVEDQATDRAYRIGQMRKVQVHLLIAAGTLEEQIDQMIDRKRSVADQVISAGEEWLTELPTGELMDLLRLREQVFGDDI
ncbi:MAG: DEAD/DEAH box helicase [Methanobacteriota archaeon]